MRGANNVRIWTKERSFVCRRTLELKVLSVCFLWAPGGQMSGYLASMSRWKPEHRIGPHLGEISDFNREVDENCALLGCYSSSGVQKRILDPWKMGPICCPETSVRNYHYSLRNSPEERNVQDFFWLQVMRKVQQIPKRSVDCSSLVSYAVSDYLSVCGKILQVFR